MNTPTEVESTLTDRYQTSVPATVRHVLKLGKRDKIRYLIRDNGEVVLERAITNDEDPALAPFLDLLEQDIRTYPERLRALDSALVRRIDALVSDTEMELDAPLNAEDE